MFYTDKKYWIAAVVEQREKWEKSQGDRKHIARLQGSFSDEELWAVAGAYRVARNFPKRMRKRFTEKFRRTKPSSKFDSFVKTARSLAAYAKKSGTKRGRRYRPLSGVSKLLWHRFPRKGFIYDQLALRAVTDNGLTAPFILSVAKWGGPPEDKRETSFLIFAASYQVFFEPLHVPIASSLKSEGCEPLRAARIVDKLLWIAGNSKSKEIVRARVRRAKNLDRKIADVARHAALRQLRQKHAVL
jgi:hypothetical protein